MMTPKAIPLNKAEPDRLLDPTNFLLPEIKYTPNFQ